MATEVLIIWPEAEEAGRLRDALIGVGLGLRPRVLDAYPDAQQLRELTSGHDAPNAVVVGMTSQAQALRILESLHALAPAVMTVAAHAASSADLLRAVMSAGASDFLFPPYPAADVKRCFASLVSRSDPRPAGTLIAIMPCRGTDGASTIALHVAQKLSVAAGRAALLVDCDVQCGVSSFRLGLSPRYSLADALAHIDRLDELLSHIVVRWRDLDLVTAPDSPVGLLGDYMDSLPRALAIARRHYPAVIADLPPALYSASLALVLDADEAHLVCTPEITSLHLARRRVSELLAAGVDKQRLRIILNRSGSRNAVSTRDVERALGAAVHHTLANDYAAVMQAAVAGGLVSGDSALGRDLEALATRIAGLEPSADRSHASGWKRILRFS